MVFNRNTKTDNITGINTTHIGINIGWVGFRDISGIGTGNNAGKTTAIITYTREMICTTNTGGEKLIGVGGDYRAFTDMQIGFNHHHLYQFTGTGTRAYRVTKGVFSLVGEEKAIMGKGVIICGNGKH